MAGAPFGHLFAMLERNEFLLYGKVFAIYNLIMDLLLVPQYGMLGAAIATGTATPLLFVFNYLVLRHYLKVPLTYPWRSFGRAGLNIAALSLLALLSLRWVHGMALSLLVPVCVIVFYLGLSTLNRVFDEKDREVLNHAIGRRIWIF